MSGPEGEIMGRKYEAQDKEMDFCFICEYKNIPDEEEPCNECKLKRPTKFKTKELNAGEVWDSLDILYNSIPKPPGRKFLILCQIQSFLYEEMQKEEPNE